MSLRIVSGERRGAKLQTPEGLETRPLRERLREALLSVLRPSLPGIHVVDLFAGSGAVALETLSNGAAHATMVDASRAAVAALRANVAKLRYEDRTTIVEGRSPGAWLRAPARGGPAGLLVLMPPYHSGLCAEILGCKDIYTRLAAEATVVCEVHREERLTIPDGWEVTRDRTYGETRLVVARLAENTLADAP